MGINGILSKGVPSNLPHFVLVLRIAIVVLSAVVLALAAFALCVLDSYTGYYDGYSGVSSLLVFVAIKTWLIFGILALFEYRLPQYYFRLVAAIAYAFSVVLWLSAWAWSASTAAAWLSYYCYGAYCYGGDVYTEREGGVLAACAGLGAVGWALSLVNFVFFLRACIADPRAANQAELGQIPVHKQGF